MNAIVTDTSIWIEYLAGRDSDPLEHALRSGVVVLPPIVVSELLSGVQNVRQRRQLGDLLQAMPLHPTPYSHWSRVGQLRARLRSKGFSISIPDAHVAQCAVDNDGLLLTLDGIFAKIATHSGLRVN